ncbi:putative protoglobin [Lyophyllum shimeji]|uniref:Protoglobin n=1 Tax=Lyophyllum shimeji TaxID=47721 RepID=A0A9P3PYX0_LYOSH|nr:putative protoglobin [Lyophyllum shimeji]
MQHIDPASLQDLPSRIRYLRDFIEFTHEDAAALRAAKPIVAPLVPTVVDMVYAKLFSFDITANAFLPRQTGYAGEVPMRLEDLTHDHPMIKFRKDFLSGYLVKLVSMDYEKDSSWEYLDKVGLMHTGAAGFAHRAKKPGLRVEYMHCAILLGYVEEILIATITAHLDLDLEAKQAVLRAFNKIIWIQNDLFARHYIPDAEILARKVTLDKTTALAVATGLLCLGAAFATYMMPRLQS